MNAAVDPVALLRSVPNFSQLSDELVRDLATKMQHRRLRQGQVLIEEEPEEEEAIHQAGSDQDAVASPGLYYVVDGLLLATQRAQDRRAPVVFQVCDGGLIGATGHEAVGLMRVVAYRDTHLLSVDPDALGDLFKKWPELYAVVSTLGEVQQQMSWLTDCLRHSPILRHVPPRFLYELLTSAHSVIVDSHSRILEAGAEPQGLMVVLSGELFMVDKDDGLTTIRILERGAILRA